MALRIGIDVGGTNTDAVLLSASTATAPMVLATAKGPTSRDVITGIVDVVHKLRVQAPQGLEGVAAVMLGTTQFINALIQCKALSKVFVVRLCGTATGALPPYIGMPPELLQAVSAGYMLASGGYEYNGATKIAPLSAEEATKAAGLVLQRSAEAVVVCGVHGPVNPSQELEFAKLLAERLEQMAPGKPVHITLSHKLSGRLGLLERESAAILNASLAPLAAKVVPAYSQALEQLGLHVPVYLTGNDGTLLTAEAAQQYPILTFNSGPVNSVRGAAYLAGLQEALVMDIGGTTTDIGTIVQGMPRMSGCFVDVCGVTTNFQLPDVTSSGLGGGSLVAWHSKQQQQDASASQLQQSQQQLAAQQSGDEQVHSKQLPMGWCSVGPVSVGNALKAASLVCGGNTLTASDVAVLLHDRLPELVTQQEAMASVPAAKLPSKQLLEAAWQMMQHKLAAAVDAAKSSLAPVPLVVVGGGAGLCADCLPGVSRIIRPQHAEVANAIGAAIPQVSGLVNTLVQVSSNNRQKVLDAAVQQATAAAVQAGAEPASCSVTEQEEIPVAYGPAGSTRLYIKVVGELQLRRQQSTEQPLRQQQGGLQGGAGGTSDKSYSTSISDAGITRQQDQPPQDNYPANLSHYPPGQPDPSATAGPASSAAAWPSSWHSTEGSVTGAYEASAQLPSHSTTVLQSYKPYINHQGYWEVSELDLDAIAIGAQILGTGGGGSARHNRLKLQRAVQTVQLAAVGHGGQHSAASVGTGSTAPGNTSSSSNSSSTAQDSGDGVVGTARQQHRPLILCLQGLPDNALVCDVGGMGAPTVSAEKLDSNECVTAVSGLSAVLPNPVSALLCAEVGGGNALEPLAVGLQLGLPVVDADLMGRAFPELQMSTAAIAGVSLTPAAAADDKQNVVVMQAAASPLWAENVLRAVCTEMGCTVGLASTPMSGQQAKQVVVAGSLSLAWRIGLAVLTARAAKADPVTAVLDLYQGQGQLLYSGKVVDVFRTTQEGFVRGHMRIAAAGAAARLGAAAARHHFTTATATADAGSSSAAEMHETHTSQSMQQPVGAVAAASTIGSAAAPDRQLMDSAGDHLVIEFQNENLVAKTATGKVLACVPDLICCLESSSGAAIGTEDIRYGLWLSVLVLPAHPLLRTPEALKVVGPAAFGYSEELGVRYEPVGKFPDIPTVHDQHLSK